MNESEKNKLISFINLFTTDKQFCVEKIVINKSISFNQRIQPRFASVLILA